MPPLSRAIFRPDGGLQATFILKQQQMRFISSMKVIISSTTLMSACSKVGVSRDDQDQVGSDREKYDVAMAAEHDLQYLKQQTARPSFCISIVFSRPYRRSLTRPCPPPLPPALCGAEERKSLYIPRTSFRRV